jgi:hypothetical protein
MSTDLQVEGEPAAGDLRIDLGAVEKQICDGLPLERARLLECQKNQVYYDGDNDSEIPSRQAEDRLDYDMRPKLVSYMTRKVVRNLTGHTYSPGPTRKLGDEAATTWLEQVYEDNGANALWKDADRLATLQGTAAFQVAASGDPRRPIRLHVWSAEELAVWCPADDVLHPQAVCTITQDGEETLYTLYTAARIRRYRTNRSQFGMSRTLIQPEGPWEPNPYGVLPFAWVHFERPTRRFWVRGVGTLVRKINARVDEKMSELAEAQRFYLKPIPLATGVPPGWRPKIQPGRFNQVPFRPGPNGVPAIEPRVWFLQAAVDIPGAWEDIRNTIDTGLSDLDIPLAAYRAEASATKSGAAMVTEQMPLLAYAKGRREHYAEAEKGLIELVLAIGGSYYDWSRAGQKAALLAEAADPHIALAWPDDLKVPWMEAASVQAQDLEQHLTSHVKIIMQERGFSREQAERELAEIVADEALYQQLVAQAGLPPAAPSLDDPASPGGDGEDDPNVGAPVPGYVRDGNAVVPVRDDSTPDPASSPGII